MKPNLATDRARRAWALTSNLRKVLPLVEDDPALVSRLEQLERQLQRRLTDLRHAKLPPSQVRSYLATIGRLGGMKSSAAKAASSAANGRKGGRPRKVQL